MNQPYQPPWGQPPAQPQQPQQPAAGPGWAPNYGQPQPQTSPFPAAAQVTAYPPGAGQAPALGLADYSQIPSLKDAKAGNQNGRPLPPGYDYVIDVDRVKIAPTHYGLKYFVEFTIVESSNPSVRPGEEYSWGRPFKDQYNHGPNDIKGHICTFFDWKSPGSNLAHNWPVGTDEAALYAYVAPQQGDSPMTGSRWRAHVWEKAKKNASPGTPATYPITDWSILEPGTVLGLGGGQGAPAQGGTPIAAPPAWPAGAPWTGVPT